MGARQLRDERTPGVQADQAGQSQFPISEPSGSPTGIADAVERVGGDAGAFWLSAADGVAETGRLVGECETDLSVVSGRRPGDSDPQTQETGSSGSSTGSRGQESKRVLEHGFYGGPISRWASVPNLDGRGPVDKRVSPASGGPISEGQESGGGFGTGDRSRGPQVHYGGQGFRVCQSGHGGLGLPPRRPVAVYSAGQARGQSKKKRGRLRDECLNVEVFFSIPDVQEKLEKWRVDYNQQRPHS